MNDIVPKVLRGKPITDALQRILTMPASKKLTEYSAYTKADLFAIRMYNSANGGNNYARKEILERIEGKVANVLAGDPDNPLKIDLATALDKAIRLSEGEMIDVTPERVEEDKLIARLPGYDFMD